MAAAVTSAWSKKPGAWALDSENHESELKTETRGGDTAAVSSDFPSLTAAITTKTKKKKPQAMSLSEFAKPSPKTLTLTRDEIVALPTGPRQRTAEELAESGGRGFRSYGNNRGSDERREREVREPIGPSRADEVDDWGSMKRPVERRERGFFGGSESKADDSDNWGSNKSFVPSSEGRRYDGGRERGGFGSESKADGSENWGSNKSFVPSSDGRRDRGEKGGFFSGSESKADESENWGSNKSFVPRFDGGRERRGGFGSDTESWGKKKEDEGGRKFGGAFDSLRERRGGLDNGGGDSDNWGKKREELGSERGDTRPRLKLQPRTVPVSEEKLQPRTVPVMSEENGADTIVAKPKAKGSNPFGEARPREEVLKEKGKDWKEIDEKLELMKVKDAEAVPPIRRGFGGGAAAEEGGEKSWRKPDTVDSHPQSADKVENGVAEEAQQDLQE